jgi:hypothetical protein
VRYSIIHVAREQDLEAHQELEVAMVRTRFDLTPQTTLLGLEAQRVIGPHLMAVAAGGTAAQSEMPLMVTGKAAAMAEHRAKRWIRFFASDDAA